MKGVICEVTRYKKIKAHHIRSVNKEEGFQIVQFRSIGHQPNTPGISISLTGMMCNHHTS